MVEVKLWKGRDNEAKAAIIKGITEVFVSLGMSASDVIVILTEFPKNNWGQSGKPASGS